MRSKYGEKLRSFFLDQTNPIYLVDYGSFQNFGNATTYTCIFIAEKDKNKNLFKACKITSDYNNESEIYNYCKKRSTPMLISGISNWIVLDNTEISIKNKIEKIGIPLKKWRVRINYGIKTGCNEAFVVDEDTKNKLVSQNANIKKILKPILRGKDIYKYGCKFARQYLIFTGYDIDIRSEYPEIIEYLNNVGRSKIAGSKGKGLFDREDQGKNWWNLRACDYYPEFDKEKIIWKQLAVERSFYYDKKGYYGLNSTAFITGSNLKYLIALLNSKLIAFAYEKFYATGNMQNDTVVYWVEFIKNLPLPPESNKIQELENIVNTINEKRDLDIKADISKEETNIDKIIYDLYGLSEEEINTVEKAVR